VGPGAYDPADNLVKTTTRSAFINASGMKKTRSGSNLGPGAYQPERAENITKFKNRAAVISPSKGGRLPDNVPD